MRLSVLSSLFLLISLLTGCYGLEAKWTPSSEEDPLPLSASYRSQLKQLAQVVKTSDNPQATLERLAEGQGMEAGELKSMLDRVEGEAGGALGRKWGGGSVPFIGSIPKALFSLGFGVVRFSARRPLVVLLLAIAICTVARLSAGGERTVAVPGTSGLTLGKPGRDWRNSFMDSFDFSGGGLRDETARGGIAVVERKRDIRVTEVGTSLVEEACVDVVHSRSFDSYLPSNLLITKPVIGNIRKARKMREVGGKGREGLVLSWGGACGLWR